MPITLNTTPSGTINYIGNPAIFNFTMTGIDSPTELRRFGYQLLDGTGTAIGPVETYLPQEGVAFSFNFQEDLYPFVKTAYPQNCGADRAEPEMEYDFKLRYWELVFDKDTCETTIENSVDSATYTMLNTAEQYWGYVNTGGDGFSLLTLYPRAYELCRNSCLSVYVTGGATMTLDVVTKAAPSTEIDTVFSGPNSMVISPSEIATDLAIDVSTITAVKLLFDDNLYTTFLMTDCCGAKIVYQTAGGGYATMFMDEEDSLSIKTSHVEVYSYQPRTTNEAPYAESIRMAGGQRIYNKSGSKQITYTKIIKRDELRDLRFYEDFLNSGNFYREINVVQGILLPTVKQLVRFLPNSGAIKYYKEGDYFRLSITGKINQEHALPNYAI